MNYTVYQELYAQKICHKHGFLSNAGFCIKALILKVPGKTIVLTCVISVMSLAYVLRLYEREYYRQLDEDHSNLLFESYITAIWCVVITMTTVGYGDVFAVSTFGRIVSIINALWGAFIISLLVTSIGKIFELSDNQKQAVSEITNARNAAKSVKAYIQYVQTKHDFRYYKKKRQTVEGFEPDDYEPKAEEVTYWKKNMQKHVEAYRKERMDNINLNLTRVPNIADEHVEVIKENVLDIQTKFDYLLSLMMRSKLLKKEGGQFSLGPGGAVQPSINEESVQQEKQTLHEFESDAKERIEKGTDRASLRKPAPKEPLIKRLQQALDAMKQKSD